MKTHTIIRNLLLATAIIASSVTCYADEKTDQAIDAAKSWLEFVDAKKYKKSWEEAAPFFKEKVTEKDWVKMVSTVRDPLGAVKSRDLLGAQYATTLPGAPDGEYVVIQFKTNFANKPDSVETITPMKDDKDVWRVSGYFIK